MSPEESGYNERHAALLENTVNEYFRNPPAPQRSWPSASGTCAAPSWRKGPIVTVKAWTPQEIALYDQTMAAMDGDLNNLISILREQSAESGPTQALANMALALQMRNDPAHEHALLLTALRRLMGEGQ